MRELELHSRQRLGTSHQDGILVWGHLIGTRDEGRGTEDGATGWAHLFASDCCVTRGNQGRKAEARRAARSSPRCDLSETGPC